MMSGDKMSTAMWARSKQGLVVCAATKHSVLTNQMAGLWLSDNNFPSQGPDSFLKF